MNTIEEQTVTRDPMNRSTQVRQTTQHVASHSEKQEAVVEKKNQVVRYIVGVIVALLVMRMLLLLLGARDTGFASMIYAITNPFVSMFQGIFAAPSFEGSYFDTAALLAIVVVSLIGWAISALIDTVEKPARVLE